MTSSDREVRHLLDDYPWAGSTSRLRLLGFDVEMRSTDSSVVELLTQLYAALRTDGVAAHVLSLSSAPGARGAPAWEVHLDGVRLARSPASSIALRHLLWEANQQAIERTDDLVLVHAAGAVLDGGALIFPGPMGAGKSTLVASLVRAGAGYLTDEVVALDPLTQHVQPYPKYLALDDALVTPDSIRPGAVAAPAPPRLVVAPRYERGAVATLEPLRRGEALSVVAQHAFHLDRHGAHKLDALAAMVERSLCFRLVSGDVDDATALLLGLLDDLHQPARS
jgi:hypothetical protein